MGVSAGVLDVLAEALHKQAASLGLEIGRGGRSLEAEEV